MLCHFTSSIFSATSLLLCHLVPCPQHSCPIKFTLFMHSTIDDDFLISIKVSGCLYTVSNLPMTCWSALALSMLSSWPHLVHCTRSDGTLYMCGHSHLREFNLWLRLWRVYAWVANSHSLCSSKVANAIDKEGFLAAKYW